MVDYVYVFGWCVWGCEWNVQGWCGTVSGSCLRSSVKIEQMFNKHLLKVHLFIVNS